MNFLNTIHRPRGYQQRTRRGALTVEMAFVIPIILVFFFGLWEWSRVEMIKHVSHNACFEGARLGTLPGYSEDDIEAKVLQILDAHLINGATANASYDPATGASTVDVEISVDANLTLGTAFFKGRAITSSMTLVQ